MNATLLLSLFCVLCNLAILGMNIKLYTEIQKLKVLRKEGQ